LNTRVARAMKVVALSEHEAARRQDADADAELLARIAARDRGALADLYARHQRPLFRYLCQLTPDHGLAEEILQDTLVGAWQGAARFEGRSSVRTWLFAIARRQAHDALRRRGLPFADEGALDALEDPDPGPEAHALGQADAEALARATALLPVIHREVLALNFVNGLSYDEIAAVVGVPVGTVRSRLSNAKRALRQLLDEHRALGDEDLRSQGEHR
jgi:RNA polymerase sigma-70 factor (ECF subfamily)